MWTDDNKDELFELLDAYDALGQPPPVTLLAELTDSEGVILAEPTEAPLWGFQITETP